MLVTPAVPVVCGVCRSSSNNAVAASRVFFIGKPLDCRFLVDTKSLGSADRWQQRLFSHFLNAEALMALNKRGRKKRKISPKDIKYLQLYVLAGLCSGSGGVSQLE